MARTAKCARRSLIVSHKSSVTRVPVYHRPMGSNNVHDFSFWSWRVWPTDRESLPQKWLPYHVKIDPGNTVTRADNLEGGSREVACRSLSRLATWGIYFRS